MTPMSTAENYERFYLAQEAAPMFPNEAVVRIFRGRYPNLDLRSEMRPGMVFCDVGCGDGRNLLPLKGLGLRLCGVEVTPEIAASTQRKLAAHGLEADIRAGTNAALPFSGLDVLLSWNSAYYLGAKGGRETFEAYAAEFARATAPAGFLVLSVPMRDHFVFTDAAEVGRGLVRIIRDPYGVRDGEVMRVFDGPADIKTAFPGFHDFRFASIRDDFFGQPNRWWLAVARRR